MNEHLSASVGGGGWTCDSQCGWDIRPQWLLFLGQVQRCGGCTGQHVQWFQDQLHGGKQSPTSRLFLPSAHQTVISIALCLHPCS